MKVDLTLFVQVNVTTTFRISIELNRKNAIHKEKMMIKFEEQKECARNAQALF